ncbi:MAG: PAS domain-containing protein [Proteobacteria bacterium]|nr:PAS domain-containing protein [Pseudomonadota bacterium]
MDETVAALTFPIVGIGAGAGGLEALEAFFSHVAPESGLAFVVVQHLSPENNGLLAQMVARHTSKPVHQITNGMSVVADHVYVTAPGFKLSVRDGKLWLGDPIERRAHRHSLDDFLRSLAQQQMRRAAAVILSGTGTHGTAGAQAIRAAGGICLAQNPESTAFPGMPHSLIHAGCADQVLEPSEMPAALSRYFDAEESCQNRSSDLTDVLAILRVRTRHDFTGYRKSTLLRRVHRRMGLAGVVQLADYTALLRETADEVAALANDLMVNVTGFFRDREAWEALRSSVIDPLCETKDDGVALRAWVTACASGEEAYTLAILLAEAYRRRGAEPSEVKIFATDMADRPLALARAGVFPAGIEAEVPAELLERYFLRDEFTFRVKKHIRDMVVFANHDILRDPPFSRIDLCTCRNLLIYLEPETQHRVTALLHFALRSGGYLFLGNTETCNNSVQFEPVSRRWRIFRTAALGQKRFSDVPGFVVRPALQIDPLLREPGPASAERPTGVLLLQRALLERYGPPTVVVDRAEQIVYFHGATDPFLRRPAGEPTRDLLRLVRPPLRVLVQGLLRTAVRENRPMVSHIDLCEAGTAASRLEITAAPVIPSRDPDHFLVSFRSLREGSMADNKADMTGAMPDEARTYEEIRRLRSELQNTIEAYEATSEELKAANEEATSVNEELQSANEELKTSKEELQAVNEGITTVNAQLQEKILQLEATTNDLANVLSSTNLAVLFLDRELRVRRFTPRVTDLLRLIGADIGRPVTDIALKFSDEKLLDDSRAVLNDHSPSERVVVSHNGRRYVRRALPYRAAESRVEGVVITFIDVQ